MEKNKASSRAMSWTSSGNTIHFLICGNGNSDIIQKECWLWDGRIATVLKRVIRIVLIKKETFESKGLKDVREETTWLSGDQCSRQSKESESQTAIEMGGCLVCSKNRKEDSVTEVE